MAFNDRFKSISRFKSTAVRLAVVDPFNAIIVQITMKSIKDFIITLLLYETMHLNLQLPSSRDILGLCQYFDESRTKRGVVYLSDGDSVIKPVNIITYKVDHYTNT